MQPTQQALSGNPAAADMSDVQVSHIDLTSLDSTDYDKALPLIEIPALDPRSLVYLVDNMLAGLHQPASQDEDLELLLAWAADHEVVLSAVGARLLSLSHTHHMDVPSVPPFYLNADTHIRYAVLDAGEQQRSLAGASDEDEDEWEVELLASEVLLARRKVVWVIELRCRTHHVHGEPPSRIDEEGHEVSMSQEGPSAAGERTASQQFGKAATELLASRMLSHVSSPFSTHREQQQLRRSQAD